MTDNLILKDIIDAKRKNPYTENKTIDQLRKETGTAGALIPLPDNTKFKRILAGNVYAEWITVEMLTLTKYSYLFMVLG